MSNFVFDLCGLVGMLCLIAIVILGISIDRDIRRIQAAGGSVTEAIIGRRLTAPKITCRPAKKAV